MNPVSKDIKDMLEAESSLGLTFATDLFIGKEPTSPDNVVTIYDTPSFPPDMTLIPGEDYYRSSFQIRCRNKDYFTGEALLRDIMDQLHSRAHESWNGTLYTVIRATGEPSLLYYDQNDRPVFIVNFNCQRR